MVCLETKAIYITLKKNVLLLKQNRVFRPFIKKYNGLFGGYFFNQNDKFLLNLKNTIILFI